MRKLTYGLFASLVLIACCVIGCSKPVPPAAVPAAPAPGGVVVAPPKADPVPAPAPGALQVDLKLQQKLLAAGAKLNDAGQGVPTRNVLRQIGLAFHNFHDNYNGFPALNGRGDPDAKSPGLSWRVMLLPYMDEAPLFEEFHLDEPWDSEHNKTLIARMPRCYGESAEGKTRLHVLTGKGAPFQNDKRTKIAEITDGTSNTIMAFVGGPDTAEIWTKPGGREFDPQQPLKSVGNVGEKFPVVLMDGAVRQVPKTIAPEKFAAIAQHADGGAFDNLAFADQPFGKPDGAADFKINEPVTPLAPAASKLDLSFIPKDAFLALAVHPRRVYSHPVVKSVREMLPAEASRSLPEFMPFGMSQGLGQLGSLRRELGIALENLDEIVVLLDQTLPQVMMGNPSGVPPFGLIARNSAPLDIDALVFKLTTESEGVSITEHEGVALILGPSSPGPSSRRPPPPRLKQVEPAPTDDVQKKAAPPRDPCQAGANEDPAGTPTGQPAADASAPNRIAIAFVTDSVALVGSESIVRKMISARTSTTATTDLTKQLEKLGNPLVALAVDAAPLEKALQIVGQFAPPETARFAPYILGVKGITVTWDLDAKEFLNVSAKFKTSDLAARLFAELNPHYQAVKGHYNNNRNMASENPFLKSILGYTDQVVAETNLEQAGDVVSIIVPQIKDLDKLPTALKPVVDSANQEAADTQRKNNLKQIGLAFHNFHSTLVHLPALNGVGEKNQPAAGLSWRVYLLPYMDEAPLYQKFKMDEPWDSPTNKALITSMPKIFGSNPEGKTSIHVFTGPGAVFQKDMGTSFANITDGMSNTFLAIEAGDDTAEIWTKPTGLTFDPADPLKCLGNIKEFLVLFCDGRVRLIKDIDAETFSRAVQINDGKPVELP